MNPIILSHWNGRFGNRMHQYAYGVTYSKMFNVPFYLPSDWEGTHLFKIQYLDLNIYIYNITYKNTSNYLKSLYCNY